MRACSLSVSRRRWGHLVGAAKQGLLALSVEVGVGVLRKLLELEVDELVGPKGEVEPGSCACGGPPPGCSKPRAASAASRCRPRPRQPRSRDRTRPTPSPSECHSHPNRGGRGSTHCVTMTPGLLSAKFNDERNNLETANPSDGCWTRAGSKALGSGMPSQVPESGSQPAAGIVQAVGRVPSVERVEANRVRSGRAERTVKAEGCSCTVATKHQRARSGDVGGAVAVAACRRSRHPTRVRKPCTFGICDGR